MTGVTPVIAEGACGCSAPQVVGASAAARAGASGAGDHVTLADIEREVRTERAEKRRWAKRQLASLPRAAPVAGFTLTGVQKELQTGRRAGQAWVATLPDRLPGASPGAGAPTLAQIEGEVSARRAVRAAWVDSLLHRPAPDGEPGFSRRSGGELTFAEVEREVAAHRAVKVAWARAVVAGAGVSVAYFGAAPSVFPACYGLLEARLAFDGDYENGIRSVANESWPSWAGAIAEMLEEAEDEILANLAKLFHLPPAPLPAVDELLFDPWSSANVEANLPSASRKGSPASDRLCLAVSSDGRNWIKTGVILMDGASVPCLAVETDADGEETLHLYFNCATYEYEADGVTLKRNGEGEPDGAPHLSVATTTDLVSWTYRHLTRPPKGTDRTDFTGVQKYDPVSPEVEWWDISQPMDPSVAARPSGGWWMFVTLTRRFGDPLAAADDPTAGKDGADTFVLYADRLDDFTWDVSNKASRVFPTDDMEAAYGGSSVSAIDPTVFENDGQIMYFSNPGSIDAEYNWDEILKESTGDTVIVDWGRSFSDTWTGYLGGSYSEDIPVMVSNAAKIEETDPDDPTLTVTSTVLYAFAQNTTTGARGILSYTFDAFLKRPGATAGDDPSDGLKEWIVDNGGDLILTASQAFEGEYVMDAAVAAFKGCYVMVYTAQVPLL